MTINIVYFYNISFRSQFIILFGSVLFYVKSNGISTDLVYTTVFLQTGKSRKSLDIIVESNELALFVQDLPCEQLQ